ncbi:MAG: type II toxin-antitoxin system VapC family toxin [Myxococcaceae bacterium]
MITLLDTNILIDVFVVDPVFYHSSSNMLRECLQEGSLRACEVVWAETAARFADQSRFREAMETLNIEFSPIDRDSAILAGIFWQNYLNAGGKKRERVAADFLIGAHARNHGERLLTRDKGFFREHFRGLTVISPSQA